MNQAQSPLRTAILVGLAFLLPGPARSDEAPPSWPIEPGRVGDLRVGRPIPKDLLGPDLGERYFVAYRADAQPLEGFRLDDPPLEIHLQRGPFLAKAARKFVAPEAGRFRSRAVLAARKGSRVRALVVTGPGPATPDGLGVGSTLAEMRRAWTDLVVHPVPPTRGQDECVAMAPSLPGVWFYFASCRAAEEGQPVLRVEVRAPTRR